MSFREILALERIFNMARAAEQDQIEWLRRFDPQKLEDETMRRLIGDAH